MKKVIQIAIGGHANTSQTQSDVTLVALCNDGTMWVMNGFCGDWREVTLPGDCVQSDERPIPFEKVRNELSVRARNVIRSGGFNRLSELTPNALLYERNCGEKTLAEILEWKAKQ